MNIWPMFATRDSYVSSWFPYSEASAVKRLQTNYTVSSAAFSKSRGPESYSKNLIHGSTRADAQITFAPTEVAEFLSRLDRYADSGELRSIDIAEKAAISNTGEDFRHYARLLKQAHQDELEVIVDECDTERNIHRIRIRCKRNMDYDNKKVDELMFLNGRLVSLNRYPITRANQPSST